MIIKGLTETDLVNYKKISMFVAFPNCTLKCDKLNGAPYCQNCTLLKEPSINIPMNEIYQRYAKNPLTEAFVFGGLEPFDSSEDMLALIGLIRDIYECNDDIVIYTGYTKEELEEGWRDFTTCHDKEYYKNEYKLLKSYKNIIIKFGRFIANQEPHYDEVLGIKLASNNQYAEVIS